MSSAAATTRRPARPAPRPKPRPPAGPPARRRRLGWLLLALLTLVGLVFLLGYPGRTWLSQRSQLRDAQHQLSVLKQQDDLLAQRIDTLNTDAEIERLAREKYNLVRPGEESYAINPAPPPPVAVPDVWPFTGLAAALN